MDIDRAKSKKYWKDVVKAGIIPGREGTAIYQFLLIKLNRDFAKMVEHMEKQSRRFSHEFKRVPVALKAG